MKEPAREGYIVYNLCCLATEADRPAHLFLLFSQRRKRERERGGGETRPPRPARTGLANAPLPVFWIRLHTYVLSDPDLDPISEIGSMFTFEREKKIGCMFTFERKTEKGLATAK
jgi:hypothetical protein